MQPLENSSTRKVAGTEPSVENHRRAHHNALERRRRNHIKDSFATLQSMLPVPLDGRASRASILKATVRYIHTLNNFIDTLKDDIDETESHVQNVLELMDRLIRGQANARENLVAYMQDYFGDEFNAVDNAELIDYTPSQ